MDLPKRRGLKVNYDAYSSNEELLAKLQAGASGYDLIIPSDYIVSIMAAQGMLEELDMSAIPNFENIGDDYKILYSIRATNTQYLISGVQPAWSWIPAK